MLLLLLLGWQWLVARSDLTELKQELTRRMAEGDAAIKENRTLTGRIRNCCRPDCRATC